MRSQRIALLVFISSEHCARVLCLLRCVAFALLLAIPPLVLLSSTTPEIKLRYITHRNKLTFTAVVDSLFCSSTASSRCCQAMVKTKGTFSILTTCRTGSGARRRRHELHAERTLEIIRHPHPSQLWRLRLPEVNALRILSYCYRRRE